MCMWFSNFFEMGDPIEIAERSRQAVAAVLFRRAAQRPQRVLQAFRERHKTLAAEHHMGMFEARLDQNAIEPAASPATTSRDFVPWALLRRRPPPRVAAFLVPASEKPAQK